MVVPVRVMAEQEAMLAAAEAKAAEAAEAKAAEAADLHRGA